MSTLADFLLARIAEDESWARDSASPMYSDAEEGTPAWSGRILAECEAKRRIVKESGRLGTRDPLRVGDYWVGARDVSEFVLRRLAMPYADHPDYREEWRQSW